MLNETIEARNELKRETKQWYNFKLLSFFLLHINKYSKHPVK